MKMPHIYAYTETRKYESQPMTQFVDNVSTETVSSKSSEQCDSVIYLLADFI